MAAILALEKISKRFGAVVVADKIDLSLSDGEALGIIGPNGAGKTTLFGIATGTVRPDSGRVLFADNDVTRLPAERRCRIGLARSFQIPQPFSGMENSQFIQANNRCNGLKFHKGFRAVSGPLQILFDPGTLHILAPVADVPLAPGAKTAQFVWPAIDGHVDDRQPVVFVCSLQGIA